MAKRRIRCKNKKTLMIVLTFVLLGYFSVTFVQQQVKIDSLEANAQTIKSEISAEQNKSVEISEQMKEENQLKRVEDIARNDLGYLKEDEILFIDSSAK